MTASVWMGFPPEALSGALLDGAGPGQMAASAASWMLLSREHWAAAEDLTAVLDEVQGGSWRGPSAQSYLGAHRRYVGWLRKTSVDYAQLAGRQQEAAAGYVAAVAAMPTLAELAANHIIHSV